MQPVFYVLAIMGCGDGDATCQPARLEPTRYATAAQCRAQLPAAIARNTDLDFPSIAAACRRSGPLTIAARGKASTRG